MATGPYDLGPFQTLSAINFAQGGIFGYMNSFNNVPNVLRYHQKTYTPSQTCAAMGLVFPSGWTPGASGRSYTSCFLSILVGEFWRDHAANPFPGELSASPGTLANLYDKTVTHTDSGESFKISEVASSAKLCQETQLPNNEWSTHGTTSGGLTHEQTPPGGIFRTTELEYWQYTVDNTTIGTDTETWVGQFWANDNNNSPAVFTCRFFGQSLNTKITWT